MVGSMRSILACSLAALLSTVVLGCGQRGPLRLAPTPGAVANSGPAGSPDARVNHRAPNTAPPETTEATPLRLDPSLPSGPNRP